MADLTRLDAASLGTFRTHALAEFITDLKAIMKDDPNGVRSLHSVVKGLLPAEYFGENAVLGIGLMGADDVTYGKTLVTSVLSSATSIDTILDLQGDLFDDIDDNLETTIRTLLKTQGTTLEGINGEQLLDIWSDIDGDLSGGEDD
ncbi:type VII secretion system-associated protein [Streptomyces sp. NBC_01451]|uniref:type VII secretion system-associated protein n=1 Tax=Streptomyces sp. NBC_01451 TaxID=2903872 RepID=UPI002E331530|nr:type VII secretion system-associated protein [Streptomyces sp. NBC_01451]